MKGFIVRDRWGYVVSQSTRELTTQELLDLSGFADDANLEYSPLSWGWEDESDWCECGDLDCRARTSNGGNSCGCRG